jgi:hypothetical protein
LKSPGPLKRGLPLRADNLAGNASAVSVQSSKHSGGKMSLTIYAKNLRGPETKLQVLCESLVEKDKINVFSSIDSLREWLFLKAREKAVVFLITEDKDELEDLLPVIELFRKVQLILVLPDREPQTIRIGYQLEPRFLTFIDSGLGVLKGILKNMLGRTNGSLELSKRDEH